MLIELELVKPIHHKYKGKRPIHHLEVLKDLITSYGYKSYGVECTEDLHFLFVYDLHDREVFKFHVKLY